MDDFSIKAELKSIIDIYAVGRDNAIKAKKLANDCITSTRKIGIAARELRAEGYPIISACDEEPFGYYKATSREELDLYRAQLIARRNDLDKSIREVNRLYRLFTTEDNGPLFRAEYVPA